MEPGSPYGVMWLGRLRPVSPVGQLLLKAFSRAIAPSRAAGR